MSLRISVNINNIDVLEDGIRDAIDTAIAIAALRIETELRNTYTPIDTGQLRESFHTITTPIGIDLIWDTEYASYPDAGVPPHMIYPRGNALKFLGPEGIQFAKSVYHPGQIPQNYTTLTAQDAYAILQEELVNALSNATVLVS